MPYGYDHARCPKKIQNSEESISQLASRYNINSKTVHKWKHRESVEDHQCGHRPGQGNVLSAVDEAVIVETRRKTLPPLDDLYDLLLPQIPVLTRSNLLGNRSMRCPASCIHAVDRTTLVKHPWTNGMVEAMNKKVIPTGHKRPTPPNGSTAAPVQHRLWAWSIRRKLKPTLGLIFAYLNGHGVYCCGKYGQWRDKLMPHAIESGMAAAHTALTRQ